MEVIRLEKVSKYYRVGNSVVKALDNVSLRIEKGEFVSIMGPSGSGKSTLLHIIGCLDRPSKGKVYLLGKEVSKLSNKDLAEIRKKKIGFIFQTYYLFPNLNVVENVEVPMILMGISKSKRRKRALELLKLVGLLERKNHMPNELSGGERQRVCIARALANDPEIILADEPTGSLDVKSGRIVMNLLKKLNRMGKTIVVVTHDPAIASYAERIIVLKGGKVLADGISVEEALNILRGK